MKKMIKGMLLMGLFACSMMDADQPFFQKLRNFVNGSIFDSPFKFFMEIFTRANQEENGKLLENLKNNSSLPPDEQIDKIIEDIIPHINIKEKRYLCRQIAEFKKKSSLMSLFPQELLSAKVIDIQEKMHKGVLHYDIIVKTNPNKYSSKTKQYTITSEGLNQLKNDQDERDALFMIVFAEKIGKVSIKLDCQKCYMDIITGKIAFDKDDNASLIEPEN